MAAACIVSSSARWTGRRKSAATWSSIFAARSPTANSSCIISRWSTSRATASPGLNRCLRWRHPAKGMISPADFIPVAEDIGLIVAIGEWVLREACAEAMKWPADIKVAVNNLSPVQFRSRNLVQVVISAPAQSGLSPGRLELEITESVFLAETETNLAILHQLRELGVSISMDDFGTGYSSLSYLRSFPFDKIKIDRSFVKDL